MSKILEWNFGVESWHLEGWAGQEFRTGFKSLIVFQDYIPKTYPCNMPIHTVNAEIHKTLFNSLLFLFLVILHLCFMNPIIQVQPISCKLNRKELHPRHCSVNTETQPTPRGNHCLGRGIYQISSSSLRTRPAGISVVLSQSYTNRFSSRSAS